MGFNPRARGGRDGYRKSERTLCSRVSIHAPAGGATLDRWETHRSSRVSIHAPAGGATRVQYTDQAESLRFNPRARGGRDGSALPAEPGRAGFNPRARGGRDAQELRVLVRAEKFQSTRPRGARLSLSRYPHTDLCFNPRARGGRDVLVVHHSKPFTVVSIHAPAGGATSAGMITTSILLMFQSTRPRGARLCPCTSRLLLSRFNPRARGGRDQYSLCRTLEEFVSIHAPAGGATCLIVGLLLIRKVSIHAPAGGAT